MTCSCHGCQILDKFSIGGVSRPGRLVVPPQANISLPVPVVNVTARRCVSEYHKQRHRRQIHAYGQGVRRRRLTTAVT